MNFFDQFSQFKEYLKEHQCSANDIAFKENAIQMLSLLNPPNKKMEDWKYTSSQDLMDSEFHISALKERLIGHDNFKVIASKLNPHFDHIVFINGLLDKTLTSEDLISKIKIQNFSYEFLNQVNQEYFTLLNQVYAEKNYQFELVADSRLEKPVCFTFFSSNASGPLLTNNHSVKFKIGARSKLDLILQMFGSDGEAYFDNSCFEYEVGDSATLNVVHLQNHGSQAFHYSDSFVNLENQSQFKHFAFNLGAKWARMNVRMPLRSNQVHGSLMGCYVLSGDQKLDQMTVIDHQVGGNQSFQVYKGILDKNSKAVFNGKVLIQQDAQKAYSEQLNNNLMLSRTAEANSKPQLEIFADDVKASHGSTMGQLNPEELFYFESRGISKAKALNMLSLGFASEIVYKIENSNVENWLLEILKVKFNSLKEEGHLG